MKITLLILLALITSHTVAGVKYVPLNMKPGLWEYENPTAKIMEKSMANMPDEVKKMMKSQMKAYEPTQSCLTDENTKDPNYYIQKMGGNCTLDLLKSTKMLFEGNLNCSNEGQNSSINIILEVVNDKKVISHTNLGKSPYSEVDLGTISTTGIWVSEYCPASLNK